MDDPKYNFLKYYKGDTECPKDIKGTGKSNFVVL